MGDSRMFGFPIMLSAPIHLALIYVPESHILQVGCVDQVHLSQYTILFLIFGRLDSHGHLIAPRVLPPQIEEQSKPKDNADHETDYYGEEPALE